MISTASTMTKPTFIFVPGICHTSAVFSRVINLLTKLGYACHGLDLPSVGANPGLPDFSADVSTLQDSINNCLSAGEDTVVVLWSYGGIVGTEAVLPSMLKSARQKEGKAGGVKHLVYLAAPILPVGMSVAKSNPQTPEDVGEAAFYDFEAGTLTLNPKIVPMIFCNDIEDQAVVAELVGGLKSMNLGPLADELTRAAWEYTPATMVMCTKDFGLPLERAEKQLRDAREKFPNAFGTVEKLDASHVPFVSMPERVAELLTRAAGEAA